MAAAGYKDQQRQEVRDLELRIERARKTAEELQREAVTRLGGDPKTMGISFADAGPVL